MSDATQYVSGGPAALIAVMGATGALTRERATGWTKLARPLLLLPALLLLAGCDAGAAGADAGSPPPPSSAAPPPTPAPTPTAAPPASPASQVGCRRRLVVESTGAALDVPLSAAVLADSLGNGDGHVTGFEGEVVSRLDALEPGARCWLGIGAGLLTRVERTSLDRVLLSAEDLDCGANGDGLPTPLPVPDWPTGLADGGLLLERRADGTWLIHQRVVHPDGTSRALRLLAAPPEEPIPPRSFDDDVARIREALGPASAECQAEFDARLAWWREALAAGECPVQAVQRRNERLTDRHEPMDDAPCVGAHFELAALDLVGLRNCSLAPSEPADDLLDWFRGRGRTDWVLEIPPELAAQAHDDDPVRFLELAEAQLDAGLLDAEAQALLLSRWAEAPLRLRQARLEAQLPGQLDAVLEHPQRAGAGLLRYLLESGRSDAAEQLLDARHVFGERPMLAPEHEWVRLLRSLGGACLPDEVRGRLGGE